MFLTLGTPRTLQIPIYIFLDRARNSNSTVGKNSHFFAYCACYKIITLQHFILNIGKEMKSKLIKISYQNKEISQNHQESDAFSEPVSTSSTRHGLALCYFSVKFKLYA